LTVAVTKNVATDRM